MLFFNELYAWVNEKIRISKPLRRRTSLSKAGVIQHGTTIAGEWRVTAHTASYIG